MESDLYFACESLYREWAVWYPITGSKGAPSKYCGLWAKVAVCAR